MSFAYSSSCSLWMANFTFVHIIVDIIVTVSSQLIIKSSPRHKANQREPRSFTNSCRFRRLSEFIDTINKGLTEKELRSNKLSNRRRTGRTVFAVVRETSSMKDEVTPILIVDSSNHQRTKTGHRCLCTDISTTHLFMETLWWNSRRQSSANCWLLYERHLPGTGDGFAVLFGEICIRFDLSSELAGREKSILCVSISSAAKGSTLNVFSAKRFGEDDLCTSVRVVGLFNTHQWGSGAPINISHHFPHDDSGPVSWTDLLGPEKRSGHGTWSPSSIYNVNVRSAGLIK